MPDYELEATLTGFALVFLLIYLLAILLVLAVSVSAYVLASLGLSKVADRRGIRNGWLAWIPVGNLWILGSISDQYQYVTRGKVRSRRKALVALCVVFVALYVLFFLSGIISTMLFGTLSVVVFISFVGMLAAAAVLTVQEYICFYHFFQSCEPGNSVLYLLLSIFLPVTAPFLVFACRKKDGGMPPRKQPKPPVAEEKIIEEEIPEEIPVEEIPEEITVEEISEEIAVEETPAEEPAAQPTETVTE